MKLYNINVPATVKIEKRHSVKKDCDYEVLVLNIGGDEYSLFMGSHAGDIKFSIAYLANDDPKKGGN